MLTDREIKAAKPEQKKNPKHAKDFASEYLKSDEKNLHLLVRLKPNGELYKGFLFIYQSEAGKRQRMWLGQYPDLTLANARKLAHKYRELRAMGVDPKQSREAERQALIDEAAKQEATFEKVAIDWLDHKCKHAKIGQGHIDRIKGQLHNHIFPKLRKRPIHLIQSTEVSDVIMAVANKGYKDVAARVRGVIRDVFDHACNFGKLTHQQNFMRGNKKIGGAYQTDTEHRPAITDRHIFAELLRDIDAYIGRGPIVPAFMRLAPLLPQRSNELRSMRWEQLDLDGGLWTIPSQNRKQSQRKKDTDNDFFVPLPHQAVTILRELKEFTGGVGYVFIGHKKGRPISDNTANNALRAMGWSTKLDYEKQKTADERARVHCLHGFRASFLTLTQEVFGSHVRVAADYQLAHEPKIEESKGNLGRAYNRHDLFNERRELMQRWADWLDDLKADNVVSAS